MESKRSILYKTKAELDNLFSFYGNFYSEKKTNYRSLLFILKNNIEINEKIKFDAIFVMMNPGGSHPDSPNFKKEELFEGTISTRNSFENMIPAKADQTQYQLARIALKKNWEAICVLNLSDFANGNSAIFKAYLEKNTLLSINSIFQDDRNKELMAVLNRLKNNTKTGKHIYAAWGCKTDKIFIELVQMVRIKLEKLGYAPKGLPSIKHADKLLFKHPLPRTTSKQDEWLDEFIKLK